MPQRRSFQTVRNLIEFDVACTRAGIVRVGIGDRLSGDEAGYILDHSKAAVLVTTEQLLERLGAVPKTVRRILLVGDEERSASAGSYEHALAQESPHLSAPSVTTAAPNYVLYTSGTSGRPKGALHTHGRRVLSMVNMMSAELTLTSNSVFLHVAPLTHGSGSKIIAIIAAGGTNLVARRFEANEVAELIKTEHVTHTFLVPTMLQRLVEGDQNVQEAVGTLDQITFGGAPTTATLFRRAIETFGPKLTQIYGSCEAPHPITLLTPDAYADDLGDRLLSSAGRPAHSVDVRTVDEHGNEGLPEILGELQIKCAHLMARYWRDKQATDEALTPDGWYVSGDIASISPDQVVTFQDRKRDLIITGGFNVYPAEVERVLSEHPSVRQAAVIGLPDDKWGESVFAFVVPTSPDHASSDELIDWCKSRLAGYKKPRHIRFVGELPLGSSGKVLKRVLRDEATSDVSPR